MKSQFAYALVVMLFLLPGGTALAIGGDADACIAGNIVACGRAIGSWGTKAQQPDDEALAVQHTLKGDKHYDKEDYEAAIAEYSRAIDLNPHFHEPYLGRGYAYQALDMDKHAISDFTIVISMRPTWAEPYVTRGVSYAYSGDDDSALKDYETAIRANPNYGFTYNQRAYIYLRQGKLAEAEADVRKALGHLPDDPSIQHSLGDVLYYAGKTEEAILQWQETCKRADEKTTRYWQQNLSKVGRYDGPIDGRCDDELVEIFAECAKDKCRF